MNTPHINEVRSELMETLRALRDRTNPMDVDRARAVAQVAGVLVDTARVEVDYIKATGGDGGGFFADAGAAQDRPAIAPQQGAHNPFLLAGGRK